VEFKKWIGEIGGWGWWWWGIWCE